MQQIIISKVDIRWYVCICDIYLIMYTFMFILCISYFYVNTLLVVIVSWFEIKFPQIQCKQLNILKRNPYIFKLPDVDVIIFCIFSCGGSSIKPAGGWHIRNDSN